MNDPRLERYLGSLENALRPFPVGDRAEIITEIRSHVLSALERDPSTRLDTILAALGEPEMVANRYLLERGLKPTKPPISPVVKWLVIGFLATFAMMLIFITYMLIWVYNNVDRDTRGFKFMNGKVLFDAKKEQISIAGLSLGDDFGGSINMGDQASVIFDGGDFEVSTSRTDEMTWSCRGKGSSPNPKTVGETTTIDFSKVEALHCDLSIPKGRHFKIKGARGKIEFDEPRFHVSADLDAGKIDFDGASDAHYKISAAVRNGKADDFHSSESADAFKVDMRVDRGLISNEDKE